MGASCLNNRPRGFTLIELSIVLVIIGLIVGGILVGQNLISAAQVRATIAQVEKYNAATNTFFDKYRALPGDMGSVSATQFGFAARGAYAGEGDGNGVIEGVSANAASSNNGHNASTGEVPMFWADLSTAHLIDGSFTAASETVVPSAAITATTTPNIGAYLPAAKLGGGNYFYIWSGYPPLPTSGVNFYGISAISSIPATGDVVSVPGLTVQQASAIDAKVDDGLPQVGGAFAAYSKTGGIIWAAGGGNTGANNGSGLPTTNATAGSSTTCYDNGNSAGVTQHYSVEISGGSNINCALSFRMQAGD